MQKENAVKVIQRAAACLSSRSTRYKYRICDSGNGGTGLLGAVDFQPIEGKVVGFSLSDDTMVVQNGRKAEFAAFAISNLTEVPEEGDTVKVTPYARRRFDGKYLTDPVEEGLSGSGLRYSTYHLGEQKSRIPGVPENASIYLKQMVEQIEGIKVDTRRTIAQMLIDAGASKEPVVMVDVDTDPEACFLPTITFRIDSTLLHGHLTITLDRASDAYEVSTRGEFGEEQKVDNIFFDGLGAQIMALVDDKSWVKDRVEVLKKGKLKKTG